MKRTLITAALALLTGCGVGMPPAVGGTWTSNGPYGPANWRWVADGSLGQNIAGRAQSWPRCDIALVNSVRPGGRLAGDAGFIVAHELGHCLQQRYGIPGVSRCDLREYACAPGEGWADMYGRAYTAACGNVPEPLWRGDACLPDPRVVYADYINRRTQ